MVFRILFNVLIFLILIRLFRPVVQGLSRWIKRVTGAGKTSGEPGKKEKIDYSDLTPYEIEDAEFEEVKGKRD